MGRRASRSRGRRELTESGPRSLWAVAVETIGAAPDRLADLPVDHPSKRSEGRREPGSGTCEDVSVLSAVYSLH